MVTAADFRTLVLVAVGELQQIAIERRAKVEEFQRKHRTGLLTLLFTDIVDSTKLKLTFGDREAVPVIQRHHAVIREILGQSVTKEVVETRSLQARSLFGDDILRRLLPRVSLAKSTSALLRF